MSGGAASVEGQHCGARQSIGVGQPALNENVAVFSCGSIPGGGSEFVWLTTSVSVYGEKSPVPLSSTTTVSGSSLLTGPTPVTSSTVSPVREMFPAASASPCAFLRNVSANWLPHPVGPSTSR